MSRRVSTALLFSFAALAAFCAAPKARCEEVDQSVTLKSPDGNLAINFEIMAPPAVSFDGKPSDTTKRLVYSVTFHDKRIVDQSTLRLELADKAPLGPNLKIVGSKPSAIDETYKLIHGKASSARNHCNALTLDLEENTTSDDPKRKLQIEARAYDDAVAFRYVVPEQPALSEFRLAQEATEFCIAKDATTYSLIVPNYRATYESEFLRLPISALANHGGIGSNLLIGLPLLMEVPGVGWLAITEADLKDYAAMYLTNPIGSWSGHYLQARLAPKVENAKLAVTGSLPHHSAWRVLQVADDPGRLIESNILTSLNPESEIKDTSWIRPGKASWDWWSGSIGADGKGSFSTDTMKFYVDFAAKSGLEYMLIDAGWAQGKDITKPNGKVDIPEVVKYAAPKNVKVWIWAHYDSIMAHMDEALPLFAKWGVAGVKIDFVERDDQEGIDFYYRVAKKAADNHLMLDFHGCTKPSGISRTWPNIMSYEAVLGMEHSKGGARDNPEHHVMLPFTRMLAGPMDYTPGGFDNVTRDEFINRMDHPMVMGTRAHHLAMYAIYEAAFQMVSDCPQNYEGQPAFDFIKAVPAAWDETRVISGKVGQYIVMARRRGDDWFLGAMTGSYPRTLEIPLAFLGDGKYTAETYADARDSDHQPKHIDIETQTVDRSTTLKPHLVTAGGYAARLRPEK